MLTAIPKRRIVRGAAGIAAAATLALGASTLGTVPAQADPRQFTALAGFGSDTIQDVVNALAGDANGTSYTPIKSSAASGKVQITSWDAVGSTCVTPKAPGATINRPNGSSQGRRALSRAIDGGVYGTTACGAAAKPVSGLVNFARSSAGPTAGDTGTELTYIPMGRDGVSFAYYRASGAPVTSLSRADLIGLYTSGPATIGGVRFVPCGIQTGSGTKAFWQTALGGIADGTETAATTECRNATVTATGDGRIEENQADSLKLKGDSTAMTNSAGCPAATPCEVIVGMSAGSFIAQSNLVAPSHTAAGVDLGSITDNGSGANLGKPYTGSGTSLAPSATFYADTTFGRKVYIVVDTALATGFGNNDLKTLFVGPTSALCSAPAQSTVNTFGFLTPSDCGSITTTGSLIAGTL